MEIFPIKLHCSACKQWHDRFFYYLIFLFICDVLCGAYSYNSGSTAAALVCTQNNIDSGLLRAELEAIEALKEGEEEEEETDEGRL